MNWSKMHSFSPYKRGIGPDIFCPGYSVNLKKKENFKKKEKIELIFYRFCETCSSAMASILRGRL